MSQIVLASEYTRNPHTLGWVKPPKKKHGVRKTQIKKNQKSVWAKESVGGKDVYCGDLLAMMHEQTDKDLARQRVIGQEDFKMAERRFGQRMLHTDFVKKVLGINKNLLYEDSKGVKDSGAFYLIVNGLLGPEKTYTGACFRKGWMPEWTILKTDAADLPTQEGLTYGWRTVLQRLVQKKALTYRQVVKVFGDVFRNDLCGKNWAIHTQAFRN